MTPQMQRQIADDVIDRAIHSATSINPVDHACFSLDLAVDAMSDAVTGADALSRLQLETVGDAMACRLLKLVKQLQRERGEAV